MNPNYTEYRFPEIRSHPWNRVFRQRTSQDAIDFISTLLVYSPQLRPKPLEALLHPFFDELREAGCRLPSGEAMPDLFDWTQSEIEMGGNELIARLTPEWYSSGH